MYVIHQTRSFYGPSRKRSLVLGDNGCAEQFATLAAARDRIAELESGHCVLSHNESSRPEYAAINVYRLPAYLEVML